VLPATENNVTAAEFECEKEKFKRGQPEKSTETNIFLCCSYDFWVSRLNY
jgi:hypothetical protein